MIPLVIACSSTFEERIMVRRTIPVSLPLQKGELIGNQLVLYPTETVAGQDLLAVSTFGPFRPGVNSGDARALGGEPAARALSNGREKVTFRTPTGEVTVEFRVLESPDVKSEYWALLARPTGGYREGMINPAVTAAIRAAGNPSIVTLMTGDGHRPALHLYVRDGHVWQAEWLAPAER